MKKVWIFEKPSVARAVANILPKPHKSGDGFIETGDGIVTWCFGHLLENCLPEEYDEKYKKWSFESLPIFPIKWKLKPNKKTTKQFKIVKDFVKQADVIVNGGDIDREGQLLIDELIYYLGFKKKVLRYMASATDDVSIKKALSDLKENNNYHSLYQAALGRSKADWLYGMNFSRAVTVLAQKQKKYNSIISIGRVQTVVMYMVVKRDEDIENFIPSVYYNIYANFLDNKTSMKFDAKWKWKELKELKDNGDENDDEDELEEEQDNRPDFLDEKNRLKSKEKADEIMKNIQAVKNGKVINYEKKPASENQPLPFELTSLQVYVSKKCGHSLQEVLDACQKLYELGHTTYPRTDCPYLPTSQLGDSNDIVTNLKKLNNNFIQSAAKGASLSIKSRCWDDSKVGEHHAIIPTRKIPDLMSSSMTQVMKDVYLTVATYYLAQFYPVCKVSKTKIEIDVNGELFEANGRIIESKGWREIIGSISNDSDDELPALTKEQLVDKLGEKIVEGRTTPPAKYTEASLVNDMKQVYKLVDSPVERKKLKLIQGIGRSATRTGIINNLIARKFILIDKKNITSSYTARKLVKELPSELIDLSLTAKWEAFLDNIALGKAKLEDFENKQKNFINFILDKLGKHQFGDLTDENNTSNINKKSIHTYKNTSTNSKSFASISTIKTTANVVRSNNLKAGDSCPICNVGKMLERVVKNGENAGKKFLGCSNFPKCRNTQF